MNTSEVIKILELDKAKHKAIKYFSSGMKQRLKLGLAILANTQLLLLDEPCSNLDKAGITWYKQIVKQNEANRIIIVCSNHQENEYEFCKRELDLLQYKNTNTKISSVVL